MEIFIRKVEDAVIFELAGRFEFKVVGQFKQALDEMTETTCPHLILNLEEVSYMDSSALSMLHFSHQKLRSMGGRISIVNPQSHIQKILNLANLPSIIPIHSLEEEALLVG